MTESLKNVYDSSPNSSYKPTLNFAKPYMRAES